MAMPELISRLEQEAQRQVEAAARDADTEIRAIAAATERAVQEITARHLARGRAERRATQERELALARRRARARELAALYGQLARVLERARALIPEAAASTAYIDALPRHAEEALQFLEGSRPRVRCQARFASVIQPVLAKHEGAELVVDDSAGAGLVAEAGAGSVVVDNTLAARLARVETRLAIELAQKLRESRSPAPVTVYDGFR